jgi:hypothetical protein
MDNSVINVTDYGHQNRVHFSEGVYNSFLRHVQTTRNRGVQFALYQRDTKGSAPEEWTNLELN